MNLKNQPPVFVPAEHRAELEQMSKAALMDLVWDFAITSIGSQGADDVVAELRTRRDVILEHRKQAR
jgi:hypothetical protein